MIVEVTADDIEHGKKEDCFRFPVALAIGRLLPEGSSVSVTMAVWVWSGGLVETDCWAWDGHLPAAACIFIRDFDEGWDVKPFSFDIPIPEKFLRGDRRHCPVAQSTATDGTSPFPGA